MGKWGGPNSAVKVAARSQNMVLLGTHPWLDKELRCLPASGRSLGLCMHSLTLPSSNPRACEAAAVLMSSLQSQPAFRVPWLRCRALRADNHPRRGVPSRHRQQRGRAGHGPILGGWAPVLDSESWSFKTAGGLLLQA